MGIGAASADLLFKIGADADEASAAVQQFRGLLSGELGKMHGAMGQFMQGAVSSLTSFQGGLAGIGAGIASALAAGGAALVKMAQDAAQYAEEIDDAQDVTGMTAEELSRLRHAAQSAGVGWDTMTKSLAFFAVAVDKAAKGSEDQVRAFLRLGISQKEVREGQKDLHALLMRTMDGFNRTATASERAALAKDLFSRGGRDLVEFLSRGADAARVFGDEAQRLGMILHKEDLEAAKALKLEMQAMQVETDVHP